MRDLNEAEAQPFAAADRPTPPLCVAVGRRLSAVDGHHNPSVTCPDVTPFQHPGVAAKFAGYPPAARRKLLVLRELVLRTAAETPGVGELEETLKWGEPAYVTKSGSGSTLRMDWKKNDPEHYAMYFHCQTGLVETFRTMFPNDFQFQGNRALVFAVGDTVPTDALAICVAASLTYHLKKQAPSARAKRRE